MMRFLAAARAAAIRTGALLKEGAERLAAAVENLLASPPAGRRTPARRRRIAVAVARSHKAYLAARYGVLLVFFIGMLLVSLGFFYAASDFIRGLTGLERGGSAAAAAPRYAAPTPTADDWAGFIPMRVAPTPVPGAAGQVPAPEQEPGPQPLAAPTQGADLQPTPVPAGPPDRLVVAAIRLDAPVVIAEKEAVQINGADYLQWQAPDGYAAGWQEGSAPAGAPGNTVLNGHHNVHGAVFGRLSELKQGDALELFSGDRAYPYLVSQVMILEERGMSVAQRLDNARWILPSGDTRLTLVTCWPPQSNTHRLIVVAVPAW